MSRFIRFSLVTLASEKSHRTGEFPESIVAVRHWDDLCSNNYSPAEPQAVSASDMGCNAVP